MTTNRKKEYKAGITVFLSLTLLVIMALLGTMVEVTRGKVCQVHGRRTLKSAVDSLMTEYSRPLYKEYHLFFLEDVGKSFEQSIAEYAADTLNPPYTLASGDWFSTKLDLYDGVLNDVQITEKKYVGESGGELLKRQISDYMKRSLASDAIENFMGDAKSVEGLESSAKEMGEKAREEKEAAELDFKMLELMRLIDGVEYSEGMISGQEYFVKMFYRGKKRAEDFGITEDVVWDAIKGNMVDVDEMLEKISTDSTVKDEFLKQVEGAAGKAEDALGIVKELGDSVGKMNLGRDVRTFLSTNQRVFKKSMTLLKGPLTEEDIVELKELWKSYDTSGVVFDYTGIGEEGGAENPLDCFGNAISDGLSRLVMEDYENISEKKVVHADHYQKLYAGSEVESKDYAEDVQDFSEKEEVNFQGAVKDIANVSVSDFMLFEYIKKFFSSVVHPVGEMEKRLDYEWEYIVCGKNSDKKNLEQVINRMVLMRSVINTAVIAASSAKRETAYAAALAIVGFTGLEPLIRFTQTMLIVLWGMSESLVDVAAILQEKRVPLIKTEKDMTVEFSDLYCISHEYIMDKVKKLPDAGKNEFGYEQYLMLFMLGNGSTSVCCRMMDLMEWNIKDNYFKGFNLGTCVGSFCVSGVFSFSTKFFRVPYIQDVLDRKLERFGAEVSVDAGYAGFTER